MTYAVRLIFDKIIKIAHKLPPSKVLLAPTNLLEGCLFSFLGRNHLMFVTYRLHFEISFEKSRKNFKLIFNDSYFY